mgnify:CR=1 FL=1
MSNANPVTDATFDQEVLQSEKPVLVDFWASWCSPCKMIAPILDQVAAEKSDKLKVVKLNVDENPGKATEFGVMSIPTLILFKGGKAAERFVGYMPKSQLERQIEPHL